MAGGWLEGVRPPEDIRDQLDIGFRTENQSVVIFEQRPYFRDKPKTLDLPVAKMTYVKGSKIWKVYRQRADDKWHRYEPVPEVKTLEEFLTVLDADENGCFWG